MKSFILFFLLNVSYINNSFSFKPNIFWIRAKKMTNYISGEVYKRRNSMLKVPIVARTNIINGGFYNGNKKQTSTLSTSDKINGNLLYQGHASSGYVSNISTSISHIDEYKYTSGGLYEEYRKSIDASETLVPVSASSYTNGIGLSRNLSGPAPVSESITENNVYSKDSLYEEYRKSLQKTNRESETISHYTRKSVNTSYGFYEGPKNSTHFKNDKLLYEPPNVVNTKPYTKVNNKYKDNGFYKGP